MFSTILSGQEQIKDNRTVGISVSKEGYRITVFTNETGPFTPYFEDEDMTLEEQFLKACGANLETLFKNQWVEEQINKRF